MISKKDFKKISDWLWEIPKSFRDDMRVPARIYASEKMLEEVFRDQSISQLINGTTLPGIVKYGIAMPDCHEGYSVPIGFVGAMRTSDGIISPGACVSKNTKILHPLGYYFPIDKFEKNLKQEVCCFELKRKEIKEAEILRFFKIKINPTIFKVKTKTGREIKATGDHPFYTPLGMRSLKDLKEGDKIALYPFEGVPYEKPKEMILVDEEKIERYWRFLNQNPAGHGLQQIISKLKKRGLLPLKTTSPQFPLLLKVMGYLLGDGTMYFEKGKEAGKVDFYGREEDLKLIKKDIEKIGFKGNIYKRWRKHKIKTFYNTYQFERKEIVLSIRYSSFALLLWALGMPIGKKAKQDWTLPNWLFKLPLWQKRLFLASLFGAELSSPKTITGHRFNFYPPVLGINKNEKYIKSGRRVLEQIERLLKEFGVKKRKIVTRKDYKNKKNEISYRNRLILSSEPESLINLWTKIGYEYQNEKKFLGNLAVHYIKLKRKFIEEKILKQGIKSRKGLFKFQKSQLNLLQNLIKKGGRKLARPFIGQFPTFEEFVKKTVKDLGKNGVVWEEIEKVEKVHFNDYVYDFTVNHPDHNFIANGFVVSNCGFDINCGVRLLTSEHTEKEIKPYLEKVATEIQKEVPSGLGRGRQLKFSIPELDKILEGGVPYLVEKGYGEKEDIENCEANGKLEWADAKTVSNHAKNRGRDQVGTLGSGNHFLEIQKVAEIFDERVAEIFGLFKDQIVIMIHSGSRGLGHQVCSDYLREFIPLMLNKYKIKVPDREFACVPFNSPEGQRYFSAMAGAANYAWANRQMIAHFTRKAWKSVLGEKASKPKLLYDVAHNIIKKERYKIGGMEIEVAVHRKGATRAFPPGHSEIPEKYQSVGQPVIIPGSMGTASYILVGTKEAEEAFYSTCHGSGRTMSRHAAIRSLSGREIVNQLERKGIVVKCYSLKGIAEEAPQAYKNVDEVVEVVHNAGLSKKVAKLLPLAVIKGE
jgi:tRNA-splicing ligase RtcB